MDKEYYKILFEKYLRDDISEEEKNKIVTWMRENTAFSAWWEKEFDSCSYNIDTALKDNMLANIKSLVLPTESMNIQDENPVKRRKNIFLSRKGFSRLVKWAAVLFIPLILAFMGWYYLNPVDKEQVPFIVKVPNGDMTTVMMPDGTDIMLNSGSQLMYGESYGKDERRVKLYGEGYFKVAHDTRRPFIVQLEVLEIKVLGTVFNVRAYSDSQDITIVLLEGKVRVNSETASVSMQPGEKLTYNRITRRFDSEKVNAGNFIAWTSGKLYFNNESLENIVKTLSRVYDVTIRYDSSEIADEYFTGTIPGGGIKNALDILKLTSSFDYVIDGTTIILMSKY